MILLLQNKEGNRNTALSRKNSEKQYSEEETMKIIFLDFDGVMDTAYYGHVLGKDGRSANDEFGAIFDPNCVKCLKEIIDKTGAEIVVTSSWKSLMTYRDMLNMWEQRGLPGYVIDMTPVTSTCRHRGDEIDAWLKECKEDCQYVIIDDIDESNFNEHQLPRLIVVNPYHGLDKEAAEKAIELLQSGGEE